MPNTDRRKFLSAGLALAAFPGTLANLGCSPQETTESSDSKNSPGNTLAETSDNTSERITMQISYLEIVTPDVSAVCSNYSQLHGVTFGDGDAALGGARTTKLAGGGMLGVRAPMHDAEKPAVRPYILVEDINAAVDAAKEAGAQIAVPPMKLEGHGTCAIYFLGGIECALWQV